MSTNHTPGPWAFRRVHSIKDRPATALLLETVAPNQPFNDPCVLAVREDWIGWLLGAPRGIANAYLIEAAPDLLAACEAVITTHIPGDISTGHVLIPISVLNAARVAIAKAKGGAP